MGDSPYLSVIRVWAALAWADGVIAPTEAAALQRLIDSAELDEAEREKALGWIDNKVDLEGSELSELSETARIGIYNAALRLAAVDRNIADEERAYLTRLQGALGLSPEAAAELESKLPQYNES